MSNEAAFLAALNANFTAIANKIDTLVSRDGDSPNQMTFDLDMNSKRLINLGAPQTPNEPLRAGDVVEGTVIQYLASAEQAALDAAAAQAAAEVAQQAAEDAAAAAAGGPVAALRADYEVGAAITSASDWRTAIGAVSASDYASGTGITAASWRSALSVVASSEFTGANQSLASSGYQKLPGGIILQWGSVASTSDGNSQSITFPLAFPATVYSVQVTGNNITTTANAAHWVAHGVSTTGFTAKYNATAAGSSTAMWFAIGR